MNKVVGFFTEIMRKYLPDPFVFAILLTLLTMVMAVLIEKMPPIEVIDSWGDGFWGLLSFTTQMAVILILGYVLATAPLTDKLLDKIVDRVEKPKTAIIIATLVGGIGSYLNWGFGLVIGGIIAKKLALKVKGVHYPLIIAAAYSGFTMYGLGFSASIPVLISTKGHPMEAMMGIIPLKDTIFSVPMLLTALVTIITLPIVNSFLHPKESDVVEIDPSIHVESEATKKIANILPEDTLAAKLNNSRLISFLIGGCGLVYIGYFFMKGQSLNLNLINFTILFVGILLLGTPIKYVEKVTEGARMIGGIILQYPFYAGIMAIMAASGLVDTISKVFVDVSTPETLPVWGLWSSFLINFFAPSGGGHWAVQGPFMIEAAKELGSSLGEVSMSVMLGNAWNDLVQPFWILPALALSKLKLKDIMGYTVIMMLWIGVVYTIALLAWAYLF